MHVAEKASFFASLRKVSIECLCSFLSIVHMHMRAPLGSLFLPYLLVIILSMCSILTVKKNSIAHILRRIRVDILSYFDKLK